MSGGDGLVPEVTIEKSQIAKDEPASVSAMPEGLPGHLTAAEAADLLSYLASLTGVAKIDCRPVRMRFFQR